MTCVPSLPHSTEPLVITSTAPEIQSKLCAATRSRDRLSSPFAGKYEMRVSISNIAWDTTDDRSIAAVLSQYAVDAIDVAPGKYFPDPTRATTSEVDKVRRWWAREGVEIVAMQSLLFGTSGLNLFAPPATQEAMLHHLDAVCRIGQRLGARYLVFGSPRNRDRGELSDIRAINLAIPFFRRLGDIAQRFGMVVCLEPNPECYGANFMTNSAQTALVVERTAHRAIKMQLDSGSLTLNNEEPFRILEDYGSMVEHIHVSEPDLLPIGDGGCDHTAFAEAVRRRLPDHIVSIEMRAAQNDASLSSVERALELVTNCYCDTECQVRT